VALNVIKPGAAPLKWQAWDGDSPFYNITMADAQPFYKAILQNNYSMLIYNGLRDTAGEWAPSAVSVVLQVGGLQVDRGN
jgi:hypothetical protein